MDSTVIMQKCAHTHTHTGGGGGGGDGVLKESTAEGINTEMHVFRHVHNTRKQTTQCNQMPSHGRICSCESTRASTSAHIHACATEWQCSVSPVIIVLEDERSEMEEGEAERRREGDRRGGGGETEEK